MKTLELTTWDQILLLDYLRQQLKAEQDRFLTCAAAIRDITASRIRDLEALIDKVT